jgi:hypothetical protein
VAAMAFSTFTALVLVFRTPGQLLGLLVPLARHPTGTFLAAPSKRGLHIYACTNPLKVVFTSLPVRQRSCEHCNHFIINFFMFIVLF